MYNIDKDTFKQILRKNFTSLVGISCKRIEIIRDNKNIPTEEKFDLIRDLIKELNYETMRNIIEKVDCFSKGITYNIKLNKPTSN